ncbi:hypothetical protein [Brenneria salicis]|uniref:hypothetical protein n=1 Tax=Brenneria salicis TaxID=55214 RepID=UPI00196B1207|nr:hypothetical protein [Brenneria salicis]
MSLKTMSRKTVPSKTMLSKTTPLFQGDVSGDNLSWDISGLFDSLLNVLLVKQMKPGML